MIARGIKLISRVGDTVAVLEAIDLNISVLIVDPHDHAPDYADALVEHRCRRCGSPHQEPRAYQFMFSKQFGTYYLEVESRLVAKLTGVIAVVDETSEHYPSRDDSGKAFKP